MKTPKPTENETELRVKILNLLKGSDAQHSGYTLEKIMTTITSDKQRLLKELIEQFQNWKLDTPQQLIGADIDLPETEAYTRGCNKAISEVVLVIQNKLEGLS